ncbi:MAG: hypothetical protein EOO05_22015 [Chitinophagaceae bacterium]|nr:MAG: hypothetical protein EOO05_22015 [Chitinophagaceae bacterium]
MFQEFSWGQFLLFSALLSFLWYLLVALLCYRAELDAFFKGKASSSGPPFGNPLLREPGAGPVGSAGQGESMQGSAETLMGASRLPQGVGLLSPAELGFSPRDDGERYGQVGLVADVLEELKILFAELAGSGGGKQEFFGKLERIKQDYGPIAGHPSIGRINEFIRDAALFPVSDQELKELWY